MREDCGSDDLVVGLCNVFSLVLSEMGGDLGWFSPIRVGLTERGIKRFGQGGDVAIREGHAAGADGLWEATPRRADDGAATSDAFESNDAEGFRPAGGNDEEAMGVEFVNESIARERTGEANLVLELEANALIFQRRPLGAGADQGEMGTHAARLEQGKSVEQKVGAFVRDETTEENEVARLRHVWEMAEEIIAIGVRDDMAVEFELAVQGMADRNVDRPEAGQGEFEAVEQAARLVEVAVPGVVGGDPKRAAGTAQEPDQNAPQADVGVDEDVGLPQEVDLREPARLAQDGVGGVIGRLMRRLRDDGDRVTGLGEAAREGIHDGFQTADAGQEGGGKPSQAH